MHYFFLAFLFFALNKQVANDKFINLIDISISMKAYYVEEKRDKYKQKTIFVPVADSVYALMLLKDGKNATAQLLGCSTAPVIRIDREFILNKFYSRAPEDAKINIREINISRRKFDKIMRVDSKTNSEMAQFLSELGQIMELQTKNQATLNRFQSRRRELGDLVIEQVKAASKK